MNNDNHILSVRPSACLSVHLFVCQSVCLSVCLSVCVPVRPSTCLSVCSSVCPPVSQSICQSVCPSISLSVCPSICLSVHLSVCLSICLFVCHSVNTYIFIHQHYYSLIVQTPVQKPTIGHTPKPNYSVLIINKCFINVQRVSKLSSS